MTRKQPWYFFSGRKKHSFQYKLFSIFILASFLPSPLFAAEKQNTVITALPAVFKLAKTQALKIISAVPANKFPITATAGKKWRLTDAAGWTSGFFPGILWLLHEESGGSAWKKAAQKKELYLQNQQFNTATHDVGFIVFNSFGNAYRLTGQKKYKDIVLNAARSLATRYNRNVGLIRSWESAKTIQPVIIDNLMNLEILFWAAKNGGEKRFYDIAAAHAKKTARDFVRPNGSTFHVVNYRSVDGKILSKTSAQGYAPSSTWVRGQAWAIYGFTVAYRETRDQSLLTAARKTADFFIKKLPADGVPYWDFDAPDKKTEPRDSSAAAIAASGLLELSQQETSGKNSAYYRAAAEKILTGLSSKNYLAYSEKHDSILLHGTYNKHTGDIDQGTIWGDYYFLEALLKLKNMTLQ